MALALLAHAYASAHGMHITALTVDHGLRTESAAEAAQVGAWMQARGIAHQILRAGPIDTSRNLQAHARAARYAALTGWCIAHTHPGLLVAHQAEDQAETVALQRHRGSTPPSRSGMAFVSPRNGISLLRPLLGIRKTQLQDYLRAEGQGWIEDPSNQSDRHARNRVRRTMDEATMRALWHEAQAMGRARHEEDIARSAWLHSHATLAPMEYTLPLSLWQALTDTIRTDILSHMIRVCGGKAHRPRMHETARLDTRLRTEATGKATLGACVVRWEADRLTIVPEPARTGGLDVAARPSHMSGREPPKALEEAAFWWFNDEPYF